MTMSKYKGTVFPILTAAGLLSVSCVSLPGNHQETRIAFLGDSITNFGHTRPDGYVNLVMDGLARNGINAVKIPAGVNGNDSSQMAARVERDAIAKKPDILIVSCGVNDVNQFFSGGKPGIPLDSYKANMTKIVECARKAGIRVLLLTATPLGENPKSEKNLQIDAYNRFLHTLAKEKECPLIDVNAAMWKKYRQLKNSSARHRGRYFTSDGIHMNRTGNIVLASEILRAFGVQEKEIRNLCAEWEKTRIGKSGITIEKGLFDNMVMQRNAQDVCEQAFSGTTKERGKVYFSCGKSGKIICGEAKDGRFSGVIKGLKTGGPYDLELMIGKEKRRIGNVLVGDVWILAGQSNMQGCGRLRDGYRLNSPDVRAYYMNDVWDIAVDPITVPMIAKAQAHWDIIGKKRPKNPRYTDPLGSGVGPGVAFGNELLGITGVPQGLIACAHGGTRMEQWDPGLKKNGDGSLYGAMLNRVERNGGKVSGVLWYQGESDATLADAPKFSKRLDGFVHALRRDLNDPELRFIQVQLARLVTDSQSSDRLWNVIRREQLLARNRHKNLVTVPAIDLEMGEGIHLSGQAQHLLGKRFAYAACFLQQRKGFLPPIEFVKVQEKRIPGEVIKKIEIEFGNVAGKLTSDGRPSGFTLNGKRISEVIRTELHGNRVVLYVGAGMEVKNVSYGFGTNPYCNIVDGANRSLPCFSVAVTPEFVRTGYVKKMRISRPVLMDGDVRKVTLKDVPSDGWYMQPASSGCWMLPRDLKNTPKKPGFRFFKVKYDNPRTQKLKILVGYDAPAKVFCDGKEIHCNPDGTNPIIPDQYTIEVEWSKGTHEIILAEAMHNGNAYGITLALEGFKNTGRKDLPVPEAEYK